MRCFVAITLPEEVAGALAEVGATCPLGRAVPEENLHLTLAFLDEISEMQVEELDEALMSIRPPRLSIELSGLGTFGGGRPRALWARVVPNPALTALQKDVVSAARRSGITLNSRRFVPHVTLVRFRHGTEETVEFQRYVAGHAGLSIGPVHVGSFVLFASRLGPGGARYEELIRYPLRVD